MRIEIDKEEYKDLIETKEEFLKTVRKLDNITIENIKLTDKLQAKEQECEELKGRLKYIINENKVLKDCATDEDIDIVALKNYISTLEFSNDQLKDVIKKYEECNKFLVEENGKTYTRLEYKLLRILAEIKDIVEGMHDLWINKTPYTDMDNLVKHLLECELNRIRYKLDEINEC